MGAQFCVALLRLKRLTGIRNHQHLLDLESDIIGTQSKVVRFVVTQSHTQITQVRLFRVLLRKKVTNSHTSQSSHLVCD